MPELRCRNKQSFLRVLRHTNVQSSIMLQKMRQSGCEIPITNCSRAGIHMRQVSLLQCSEVCCV